MEVVPLSEAKDRLSSIVSEVATTHEHYTITRQGHPVAVMLPVEDLDAIEETLFWLRRELSARSAEDQDGPDVSGEEMAELMKERQLRDGAA